MIEKPIARKPSIMGKTLPTVSKIKPKNKSNTITAISEYVPKSPVTFPKSF